MNQKQRAIESAPVVDPCLIEAMALGDEDALAAFYDDTRSQVFGLCVRILGDRAIAEEVALDVYMQVWRTANSYSAKRGSPMAWLMTLTRSRAIDRRRQFKPAFSWDEHRDSIEQDTRLSSVESDAWAVDADRADHVQQALSELSFEQRQVLELAYFGGLSHSDIAEYLQLPLGTVKTRIRGGMTRLRSLLRPLFGEEFS